jgi:hypothetical protein
VRIAKTFFRWFALLAVISFAMAILQWLAAPEGDGASGWGNALPQVGHPKLGEMLRSLSSVRTFGAVSGVCERVINTPRNHLLHDLGYLSQSESTYFYATPHRLFTDDWRSVLMFGIGTVVVYLPLIIGIALIRRSGWKVMREPVLISSLLFVIVAIGFLAVSKSDEQSKLAVIFTALSLLTAAVGILWSPLLSRRSQLAALASLLITCSIVGMFAVTKGSGPRDAPSYPVFFGWSLMMLVLEGGSFLLLVWLLLRMMERLRGDAPPPPMGLKTAGNAAASYASRRSSREERRASD